MWFSSLVGIVREQERVFRGAYVIPTCELNFAVQKKVQLLCILLD